MSTKPKRRPPGTVKRLCESLHLSRQRVTALLAAGMPDDPQAAAAWRKASEGGSVEELRRKRIALVGEQTKREELENERRRGLLIPRAEHVELSLRSAVAAKMALWELINSMPPMLAGLTEIPIAIVLEREFRQVLDRLYHGDPGLWESPIGKEIYAEIEKRIPSPTNQ
jgi:hypothetical protein